MSTTAAPFGILPSWHPSGQIRPTAYTSFGATDQMIPSGTTSAFFKGTPIGLIIGAGAQINGSTANIATGRMIFDPLSAIDTAHFKPYGVFAGVEYVDASGKPFVSDTWPAGQTMLAGSRQVVYVWDDLETVFRAQFNGVPTAGGGFGLTGKMINFASWGTGSTLTGLSTASISGTVPATGALGQGRIVKLWEGTDNLAADTYPVYEFKLMPNQFVTPVVSL